MKVLFLDFDGVLNDYYPNNKKWSDENPDINEVVEIHRNTSNFIYDVMKKHYPRRYENNSPILSSIRDLDCDKVERLNKIVKETDCKIVFSTSWRGTGVENLALLLTIKGFNYPHSCIDCTPYKDGVRGLEIMEWLDNHDDVESFAIVDDETCDIEPYYKDEVIKVKGLTNMDTCSIISVLLGGRALK